MQEHPDGVKPRLPAQKPGITIEKSAKKRDKVRAFFSGYHLENAKHKLGNCGEKTIVSVASLLPSEAELLVDEGGVVVEPDPHVVVGGGGDVVHATDP